MQLESAPRLASLLVRAPSDALARELASACGRALRCVQLWLASPEVGADSVPSTALDAAVPSNTALDAAAPPNTARCAWGGGVLLALPGAGAAEAQLEVCVRRLGRQWPQAAPSQTTPRPGAEQRGPEAAAAEAAAAEAAGGSEQAAPEQAAALRILSAALLAPLRQLHANARQSSAISPDAARWPVALQQLRAAHERAPSCAVGLVLATGSAATGARVPLLALGDARLAGVLEPLEGKRRLVDAVLGCLAQLLLLDGLVPVGRRLRAASRRRAGRASTSRARPANGSSDESDDEADEAERSASDESGWSSAEERLEDEGVLV